MLDLARVNFNLRIVKICGIPVRESVHSLRAAREALLLVEQSEATLEDEIQTEFVPGNGGKGTEVGREGFFFF